MGLTELLPPISRGGDFPSNTPTMLDAELWAWSQAALGLSPQWSTHQLCGVSMSSDLFEPLFPHL